MQDIVCDFQVKDKQETELTINLRETGQVNQCLIGLLYVLIFTVYFYC